MYVVRFGEKDCGHKYELLDELAACIKRDTDDLEDDRLPNGQSCKLVNERMVNLSELPEGQEFEEILVSLD
jgi:hypothetical protein